MPSCSIASTNQHTPGIWIQSLHHAAPHQTPFPLTDRHSVRGLAAGYLQCHLSLVQTGPESEMEKRKAIISTTISKSCKWTLTSPMAVQDSSVLWPPCNLTYLERGVILSHLHGDCLWHLVTIVFHCDHRVIDKTGVVSQVPCCCQNQEPIARKGGWEEKGGFCECGFVGVVAVCFETISLHSPGCPETQRSKGICHYILQVSL